MREFKIFVDLDNTLTSFNDAVAKLGPEAVKGLGDKASEVAKLEMYRLIDKAGESFWSSMDWAKNGKVLWRFLSQFDPVLLSSPGQFSWAPSGKKQWVAKNIPGTPLLLSENKWDYAERNAILIDDMQKNVGAWEQLGGIGVLYEGDPVATTNKLLDIIRGYSPSRRILLSSSLRHISKKVLHEDPEENKKLLEVFQEDK
jgi:hypothetical protein